MTLISLLTCLLFVFDSANSQTGANDFNGDGRPDLAWRNRLSGENALWMMNGLVLSSGTNLPRAEDLNWQLVGTGFFNEDKKADLVWHHRTSGEIAAWFLNGAQVLSNSVMKASVPTGWRVAAAEDFNADGATDLVMQDDATGKVAIWLIESCRLIRESSIKERGETGWRVCATGQFGGDPTPDLVLRHEKAGTIELWLMNGPEVSSVRNVSSIERPDLDWHLVGAADFTADGKTDLLWRHVALGLNMVSRMDGTEKLGEDFIYSTHDTDWRVAGQDMRQSRYRFNAHYGPLFAAIASKSPSPSITLQIELPPSMSRPVSIYRRNAGAKDWGIPVVTNLTSSTFTDSNVETGRRYEYQLTIPALPIERGLLTAGVEAAPIEDRGRLLLLVDKELVEEARAEMQPALAALQEDLVGDGWTVVLRQVARHDDRANASANRANTRAVASIKSLIRSEYEAGARGIYIVGHVAIPYSGYQAPDGHVDHLGAWPADMYYGDVDGVWTDEQQNFTNVPSPENRNTPGDGKFDNDFPPGNLELFVGRIDFARLPSFGTENSPTSAEARLVRNFLLKSRSYRWSHAPYPVRDNGVAYGYFSHTGRNSFDALVFENAIRNYTTFFPGGTNLLEPGDPFLDRGKSYLWGYVGAIGNGGAINPGASFLEHSTRGFVDPKKDRPVAFHLVLGSYHGDWNWRDNVMRAVLTTRHYGLAIAWMAPMPTHGRWRFPGLALGETLGAGLLSTVNDAPPRLLGDNNRMLAILGDPTLRIHVLAGPSDLDARHEEGGLKLTWKPGGTETGWFVYRAASKDGPFQRISTATLTEPTFTDPSPQSREPYYMVRALKLVNSGSGSYTNISQGAVLSRR